jgi:hypothetical protein
MMTPVEMPQARVVRKAGQVWAQPPVPPSEDRTAISNGLRTALGYAVGLWPLTGVLLLMLGLLIIAANNTAFY